MIDVVLVVRFFSPTRSLSFLSVFDEARPPDFLACSMRFVEPHSRCMTDHFVSESSMVKLDWFNNESAFADEYGPKRENR